MDLKSLCVITNGFLVTNTLRVSCSFLFLHFAGAITDVVYLFGRRKELIAETIRSLSTSK